tara:strand:- start:9 stop:254 length:246 start_codon:yes stop_codon:yes gene_type:complete
MDINWTLVTIIGALLAQGAAVVWAVSSMVSDIKYNMGNIADVKASVERLDDDIHENDVTIARIDANVEAIKNAMHSIIAQR